jgi:hypothetical protein
MINPTEEVKVHHVIRIAALDTAANPIRTHNGVADEDLADYIESHKRIRPSAALFVDGQCVFTGTMQQEQIDRLCEEVSKLAWKVDIVTRPYR